MFIYKNSKEQFTLNSRTFKKEKNDFKRTLSKFPKIPNKKQHLFPDSLFNKPGNQLDDASTALLKNSKKCKCIKLDSKRLMI